MEIYINDIFGLPWFSEDPRPQVVDVDYEDLTPPAPPKEEIIEDWTNGRPIE